MPFAPPHNAGDAANGKLPASVHLLAIQSSARVSSRSGDIRGKAMGGPLPALAT